MHLLFTQKSDCTIRFRGSKLDRPTVENKVRRKQSLVDGISLVFAKFQRKPTWFKFRNDCRSFKTKVKYMMVNLTIVLL